VVQKDSLLRLKEFATGACSKTEPFLNI